MKSSTFRVQISGTFYCGLTSTPERICSSETTVKYQFQFFIARTSWIRSNSATATLFGFEMSTLLYVPPGTTLKKFTFIYVSCMDLSTNSDYFPIQNSMHPRMSSDLQTSSRVSVVFSWHTKCSAGFQIPRYIAWLSCSLPKINFAISAKRSAHNQFKISS